MIAAYVRVSTGGQDLGSQRHAIERAARARGHRIGKWFNEKKSASSLQRPELAELRAAARRGELEHVYVFQFSRLCRSGVLDGVGVVTELDRAGCNLVFVGDAIPDTKGPFRDLVIAMFAAFSQVELGVIRERVAAARERARAEGKHWGRRPVLDQVDERRLLELAPKNSTRKLAQRFKVSRGSVLRALARARARLRDQGGSKTPAQTHPQKSPRRRG